MLKLSEKQQIARLWLAGKGKQAIAIEIHRNRTAVSKVVNELISVGVLTAAPSTVRLRNPMGNQVKHSYWSKLGKLNKHNERTCHHGHAMTKANTINQSDGGQICRECYRTYQRAYKRLIRSGFLSSLPKVDIDRPDID